MPEVITSIGSNSDNVDITGVADSGPWTVTLTSMPSLARIGDTLEDEAGTPNIYLITGIAGNDLTVSDSFGAGTAPVTGASQATVGRTYVDPVAWNVDLDDTDPYNTGDDAIGECYADTEFALTASQLIDNGSTIVLNRILLTVGDGEGHPGFDDDSPTSYVTLDWGGTSGIFGFDLWSTIGVEIEDLILRDLGSDSNDVTGVFLRAEGSVARRLIIHDLVGTLWFTAVAGLETRYNGDTKHAIRCVVYNVQNTYTGETTTADRFTGGIYDEWGDVIAWNNIIHDCGTNRVITGHQSGGFVGTNFEAEEIRNCMSTSPTIGLCYNISGQTSNTHNLATDDSDSGTGSIGADNGVLAANLYLGATDFRVQDAAADQVDVGFTLGSTQDANIYINDDGDRVAVTGTWDMGAFEFTAAAAGTILPQITTAYHRLAL